MKFNPVELCKRPKITSNMDFYLGPFTPIQRLYSEMDPAEQEAFKALVKSDFYEWVGLNDAVIEAHPNVLQILSEWLQGQERVNHLSDAASQVVDAHRDPLNKTVVNLEPAVRAENQQVIKDLDARQEDMIESIREIARQCQWAAADNIHKNAVM